MTKKHVEIPEEIRRKLINYGGDIMVDLIRENPPRLDQRPDGTPYLNGNTYRLTSVHMQKHKGSLPGPHYTLVYEVRNGETPRGMYQTTAIFGTNEEETTLEAFMDSEWLNP